MASTRIPDWISRCQMKVCLATWIQLFDGKPFEKVYNSVVFQWFYSSSSSSSSLSIKMKIRRRNNYLVFVLVATATYFGHLLASKTTFFTSLEPTDEIIFYSIERKPLKSSISAYSNKLAVKLTIWSLTWDLNQVTHTHK